MPNRLDVTTLRPELQTQEGGALILAVLAIAEEDVRRVKAYRDNGAKHMTLIGWTIMFHIAAVHIAHGRGTRAQALVESLPIPRRTIRDTLDSLVADGVITQDEPGLYRPTHMVGKMVEQITDLRLRQFRRLHGTFEAFEAASRRIAPTWVIALASIPLS